jgi:hypothetical protein
MMDYLVQIPVLDPQFLEPAFQFGIVHSRTRYPIPWHDKAIAQR